jgi:hypothetical protein
VSCSRREKEGEREREREREGGRKGKSKEGSSSVDRKKSEREASPASRRSL